MLAATDEVLRDGSVNAQTWAVCERELGADSAVLVELVTAIGAWRMIASILHSLGVPLEEGVASWPPDGDPPDHAIRWVCTPWATTVPSASVAVISVNTSSLRRRTVRA